MNVAERYGFSAADLRGPGGPLSAQALAAWRSHPRFTEAMRAAAGGLVAIRRQRPRIISDLGRLVIGNLALYLHYSRDPADPRSGLSASRIKAICSEQNVCSAGRAHAAVALMRLSGHLAPAPSRADRRLRLLVPTERLTTACRQYWAASIGAMTLVVPERSGAAVAFRQDDVFAAFMRLFGDHFCAGVRMFQLGADLTPFAQRNAGFALLIRLLLASEPAHADGPCCPVEVSVAALARRFGVSRTQVLRLLDDAVTAGLIARSGPDRLSVTVLPRLSNAGRNLFATIFALCEHYCRLAMADVSRRERSQRS